MESTTTERRRLEAIRRYAQDPSAALKSRWHVLFLVGGWLLIFIGTLVTLRWHPSPFVTVALTALGGILGGAGLVLEQSVKRWAGYAPYIDIARIDQRLAELSGAS